MCKLTFVGVWLGFSLGARARGGALVECRLDADAEARRDFDIDIDIDIDIVIYSLSRLIFPDVWASGVYSSCECTHGIDDG
jgi:hypothetical protein